MKQPTKKYIITTPQLTAAREAVKVRTAQIKAEIEKLKGVKHE
jgi:hypothetical protein